MPTPNNKNNTAAHSEHNQALSLCIARPKAAVKPTSDGPVDGPQPSDAPATSPSMSRGPIRLARFTSDTGPLTKTLSLGAEGTLIKGTAAFLSDGGVENLTLSSFDAFSDVLTALGHNQALAFGVSLRGDGPIMSEKRWDELERPKGVLLRNREHFGWSSGEGIMMFDYDPSKEGASLTKQQLLTALYAVLPQLEHAAHVWRPSAGSCIYNAQTGEEVVGIRGQRVYVWVSDASEIPRIGAILVARLWQAGYGRVQVSKAGGLLERTLVDSAVWQEERLDFASGTKCEYPLEQRRPAPERLGGNTPLDASAMPDLSDMENQQVERAKNAAKSMKKDEAKQVREARIDEKTAALQKSRGLDEKSARSVAREAFEGGRLMGDFILVSRDNREVSVGDILDHPELWHDERFHDPLDSSCEDERIAMVNLFSGGRPYLYSHAHGGARYSLCRTVATVEIPTGSTGPATAKTLELMQTFTTFYERGNAVVIVTERGEVHTLGQYSLKQKLEREISFYVWDKREKKMKKVDCPDEIVRRILDMRGERGLQPLGGVVEFPTMTATGRLLERPGFDNETRLLLLNPTGKPWPRVPARPTEQEVLAGLERLWAPFAQFPFVDAVSRGITLSALLTAVVRRTLPTAPAFMFAAPSAGSGKTLLASCVVELAGRAPVMSLPDADVEVQKTLVSLLRKAPGALFFDNVVGTVDSKALNAMLTTDTYEGRILGVSETSGALPTNVLVVLTGNNGRPVGDMCRRMLVATIDPKLEQPFLRSFPFNPLDLTRANKMDLVVAALTVLRGWKTSGAARVASGGFASFDVWEDLVRQAVVWVGQLDYQRNKITDTKAAVRFADPIANIQTQFAEDDDTEALGSVLETWFGIQDGNGLKASDLFRALDDVRSSRPAANDLTMLGGALLEVVPKAQTAKGVSKWLRSAKGRIVHGLRIEGDLDKALNNTTWYVRRVSVSCAGTG